MSEQQFNQVKVLDHSRISPSPDSVATAAFPLTFLDIPLMRFGPVQRVFFYQFPVSAAQFDEEVLPQLKSSLSMALQRFLPFCGNCVCPPQPLEPYILYNKGDYVPLLVAKSTGVLSDFLGDGLKDANDIHPLLPPTPSTRVSDDSLVVIELTSLLAVQVTLFPNSGLSIGITYRHMVSDGTSFIHFIKTWASILKAKCDMSQVFISLPVLDRSVVDYPDEIKDVELHKWRAMGSVVWKENTSEIDSLMEDKVRTTFTLSRSEIEQLKKWVSTKISNGLESAVPMHFSSYVVTSAYVWVCLIKSLDMISCDVPYDVKELCHFVIAANLRNKYDLGIPGTYFGNCLGALFISVGRSKFREEDCIAKVAEEIRHGVQRLKEQVINEHKYSIKVEQKSVVGGNIFTLASSPQLAEYETDFGWGRPEKVEVVHTDISGSISLIESKNESGGIEIGICRSRPQMEAFTSLFQQGMKQFQLPT